MAGHRSRLVAFLIAFALALAPAGSALGASPHCEAPPGRGAVEQYCESVPGAEGSIASKPNGEAPAAAAVRGPQIPADTAAVLHASGADGDTVLKLTGTVPRTQKSAAADTSHARAVPSDNPLRAVISSVGRGDTVGSDLVLAMLLGAVLVALAGWLRFRRRSQT